MFVLCPSIELSFTIMMFLSNTWFIASKELGKSWFLSLIVLSIYVYIRTRYRFLETTRGIYFHIFAQPVHD